MEHYLSFKKVYNDFKIIENNIKPFYNKLPNISSYYYTPSFYRDTDTLIKNKREVERRSIFYFTRDLSYIASLLFANVNYAHVRT